MTLRVRCIAAAAAAALCWTPFASSQSRGAPAEKERAPAKVSVEDLLVDVDFKGGTMGEYCEALRDASPAVNIILDPSAGHATIPPIKLTQVWFADAVEIPTMLVPSLSFESRGGEYQPWLGRPEDPDAWTPVVYVVGIDMAEAFKAEQKPKPAPKFNLSFKGGTAAEYLETVRRAHPPANIAAMPGVERFEIPPVEFQWATVEAAVRMLEDLQRTSDAGREELRVRMLPVEGSAEPLVQVLVERRRGEETSMVWSVAETLSRGVDPADMLTAIETALRQFESPATVRFHKETDLVIVRGTSDQLSAIDMVLGRLEQSAVVRSVERANTVR